MSNSLKEFLKEKLDVKNDTQLETHLEPIARKYASDVCERKNGRHWSEDRVVDSTEGLDPDFKLKKDNLQNLITNEIVNGTGFCITSETETDLPLSVRLRHSGYISNNILAHACK